MSALIRLYMSFVVSLCVISFSDTKKDKEKDKDDAEYMLQDNGEPIMYDTKNHHCDVYVHCDLTEKNQTNYLKNVHEE